MKMDSSTHYPKDIEQHIKQKQIEVLEFILSHASGGGNWRRVIYLKITELKNEKQT